MPRGFRLFLAMTLAAALSSKITQAAEGHEPLDNPQPVVRAVDGGLILQWRVLPASVQVNASGETEVSLPGYSLLNQPGVAQVPFASALVALPPGARPKLETQSSSSEILSLTAPVQLAPYPQGVRRDSQGAIMGGSFVAATGEIPFPFDTVEIEQSGVLRGVQLARVNFYPLSRRVMVCA